MEAQEATPNPALMAEEPGATAKEAEGVEAAGGKDGLGEKGKAGDSGSDAKQGEAREAGDSGSDAKQGAEAGAAGDSGSNTKGGIEANGATDSGSDAKQSSEAGGAKDSGSDAKQSSEAGGAKDSGSDAKQSSEAGGAKDSGSDAKQSSEAGGAKDSGSDAKQSSEAGGAKDSGNDAKQGGEAGDIGAGAEGQGAGAEEKAAVGGAEPEPQEGAAGAKPERQVSEEQGAGAEGASGALAREGHSGSTSKEPLSPETGGEEEEWGEPAPSPTGDAAIRVETGAPQPGGISQGPEAPPDGSASTGGAAQQDSGPSPTPEGALPPKEKPKRPALDRRELTRPRLAPRAQSRKAIMEKFGGAASGPAPNIKKTGGANAIKNMLLEWCRAKTRGYEHVDIQNFSSSWSSGLAFCALIHKFFPDAFDYEALDPANRRENFALAFATAEQHADCAPLLEVEDMVRMSVPDSKCVYTYVQELYRSLVDKGLVKTKKK
uniref:Smoothelin like 1 n=1 Tax=Pelodiscus sinensis TaxID=13735 RepID=K7FE56_PELSI|nr:smoothelin-like protein 1 [Pelodiscus sinensis]|eukprot:XP_014426717.1 smoothelin-like protein 1 [Pelodiscus sinensis]